MTLIASGGNLRQQSLMGLQALSREDAERELLYEQMKQAKSQKDAQTKGTVGGIGAAYLVNQGLPAATTTVSSVPISGSASGLGSAAQSSTLINPTALQASMAKAATDGAALSSAGSSVAGGAGGAVGGAGGAVGGAGGAVGGAGGAVGGAGGAVGGAVGGTVGGTVVGAGGGTVAGGTTAALTTAAPVVGAGTTGAASLAALAGPLAIGIGGAFLLSQLFG